VRIKITVKQDSKFIDALIRRLSNPRKYGLWDSFRDWLTAFVEKMFGSARTGQGGYGRAAWAKIKETVYRNDDGSDAGSSYDLPRIGTDGLPHGLYGDRPDEPLVASGAYRASFGEITAARPTLFVYGSNHRLAEDIPHSGLGNRFALPDTQDFEFIADSGDLLQIWLDEQVEEAASA
jgi:hypothetical protein